VIFTCHVVALIDVLFRTGSGCHQLSRHHDMHCIGWLWTYELSWLDMWTASGGGPLGQLSLFSALLPCQALLHDAYCIVWWPLRQPMPPPPQQIIP